MTTITIDTLSPRLRGAMHAYLEESLEEFRDSNENKDIPLHTFYMFLTLPIKGEATVEQLKKSVKGLSHAAVSRNLQILSGTSKLRQDKGLHLAEYREDEIDRRYKLYALSDKGRELRERMHLRGLKQLVRMIEVESHVQTQ